MTLTQWLDRLLLHAQLVSTYRRELVVENTPQKWALLNEQSNKLARLRGEFQEWHDATYGATYLKPPTISFPT